MSKLQQLKHFITKLGKWLDLSINLIRFVVLCPHYRSRDGTQGRSLFNNWSYSRKDAFFTFKKTKDQLS